MFIRDSGHSVPTFRPSLSTFQNLSAVSTSAGSLIENPIIAIGSILSLAR
jgi:hypothetical protein